MDQKIHHDQGTKARSFELGQAVMVRDYRTGVAKWIRGKVVRVLGPVTYLVEVKESLQWKRHVDQLRQIMLPVSDDSPPHKDLTQVQDNSQYAELEHTVSDSVDSPVEEVPVRRYPLRVRRPPDRYMA